jgi:uncharacterized cupredoxin-like copper-binding protein
VRRFGHFPRRLLAVASAAALLAACSASSTASQWTFAPGGQPTAGVGPTVAPTTGATPGSTPAGTPEATGEAGPSPSAGPIGAPPSGTAIYVSEWSVGLPTSLLAGQVNFAITNIGTIPHELLVFKTDLPPSAVPVDSHGDIIQDGPGLTLVSSGAQIDPGQSQSRVVDLTQPGTYLFVCNLPGHYKAGMFRVVTVTPPSAEQIYVAAGLSEWHVAVPTTISAGTINLEAANFGTIQHELLVFRSDLPPSQFPVDETGDIVEDGPGIDLISDADNIDPGATQTRTVDLTQPGTYLFVCNIPGHFKAGMYQQVTVTP